MRNESLTIPESEQAPKLREVLFGLAETLGRIRTANSALIPEAIQSPFLYLLFPWIVEMHAEGQRQLFDERRHAFEQAGFRGYEVRDSLEGILNSDKHLKECCSSVAQLAHCVDLGFVTPASSLILARAASKLDEQFSTFVAVVYGQGRFKAVSLCRIFNFFSDESSLTFGNVRVERMDSSTISRILGETSSASFIHPPSTGEHFIVNEAEGPCDDPFSWLVQQRSRAELFVHVLQYFKDGVVHIDYAMPHFLPQWVNQIRKWGIFFIGNPRRIPYEQGQRKYTVDKNEIEPISFWWDVYQRPDIFSRISNLQHSLRQAGLRAGEYYEANHTLESPSARLLSLAVALESLFSPDDKGEFTFRIPQSLSQLIGSTPGERAQLFAQMKKFYSRRSELVHGQYNVKKYLEGTFVTHEDCDAWASPIRRAILAVLILYLRGQNKREDLLKDLTLASLDSEVGERLRSQSQLDRFLAELKQ